MKLKAIFLLIGVLIVIIFLLAIVWPRQKPPPQKPLVPSPTPLPFIIPSPVFSPLPQKIKARLIKKLPVITENYTIEYLSKSDKFLVIILKNPFELNKKAAEEWFRREGADPAQVSIQWGSAPYVAPGL